MQYKLGSSIEFNNKTIKKVITVFIAAVLFLTFFSGTLNNITLPRVKAERPSEGMIVKQVEGEGVVESKEIYDSYSESALKVKDIRVSIGQQIKKGDIIMVLDTQDLKDKLNEKQLAFDQKKIDLEKLSNQNSLAVKKYNRDLQSDLMKVENAKKNLDNLKTLNELGGESLQNVEKAENELKTFQSAYDALTDEKENTLKEQQLDIKRIQLDLAAEEKNLAKLKKEIEEMDNVVARGEGVITELNGVKGSFTEPAKPLYRMTNISKGMNVRLTVERLRTDWLEVGDDALLTVKSSAKDPIAGKISGITDNSTDKANLKDILIEFDSKGFKGGERLDVTVSKEAGPFNLIIPKEAVHEDINGSFVYVAVEKKGPLGIEYYVQRKNVFIADSSDTKAALISGLLITDLVISNTDRNISDESRIRIDNGSSD